jgi:hypothetical protein
VPRHASAKCRAIERRARDVEDPVAPLAPEIQRAHRAVQVAVAVEARAAENHPRDRSCQDRVRSRRGGCHGEADDERAADNGVSPIHGCLLVSMR